MRSSVSVSDACFIGALCMLVGIIGGALIPAYVGNRRDEGQLVALREQTATYWEGWMKERAELGRVARRENTLAEDQRSLQEQLAKARTEGEQLQRSFGERLQRSFGETHREMEKARTELANARDQHNEARAKMSEQLRDAKAAAERLRDESSKLAERKGAQQTWHSHKEPEDPEELEDSVGGAEKGDKVLAVWAGTINGGIVAVRVYRGKTEALTYALEVEDAAVRKVIGDYTYLHVMIDNRKGTRPIQYLEGTGFIKVVTEHGYQCESTDLTLRKLGLNDAIVPALFQTTRVVPGARANLFAVFPPHLDPRKICRVFWGAFRQAELQRVPRPRR